MAVNAIFEVYFFKCSISKESNVTYLLRRIYRKFVRNSFVSRVYYGPSMVGPGEKFHNQGIQEG